MRLAGTQDGSQARLAVLVVRSLWREERRGRCLAEDAGGLGKAAGPALPPWEAVHPGSDRNPLQQSLTRRPACWPLLLLSRGGHPAGGRGIGFPTAGPKRPRPSTATSQTHPGSSPPSPATMENRKSDKGPARKLHAPPPSHPPRICHPIKV